MNDLIHATVKVFNMITSIAGSKSLLKQIVHDCKCRLDSKNVIQTENEIKMMVDVNIQKL